MYGNILLNSIAEGDIETTEKLLSKGKYSIHDRDEKTLQTPLHIACYEGHFELVYYLLTQGSDVTATDSTGWTPLHCSAVNEHLRICSLLLTRGANPSAVNKENTSPLHYIIRSQYSEELIEVLDLMLERGVNLECRNVYEETPLIQAASKGLTESVRYLLDHKANVNSVNKFSQSALHLAVENGNRDTVLLLLKNGADIHIKSNDLQTPLDIAKKEKKQDLIEILERRINVEELSTYTAFQGSEDDKEQPKSIPFIRLAPQRFIIKPEVVEEHFFSSSNSFINFESSNSLYNKEVQHGSLDPIVNSCPGFRLELGKKDPSSDRTLLFSPCNYKHWFYYSEHYNYVGRVNKRGSTEKFEPLIVSVLPEKNYEKLRIIIWSRLGDKQIFYNNQKLKHFKLKQGLSKELFSLIKDSILETRPKDLEPIISLEYVKETSLRDKLLEFETYDPLRAKCFSVGILYCKSGQLTEEEQFGNETGSESFNNFLNFLGDKIPLKGWMGYRGDLDTKTNSVGKYSLYRRWKGFEIMFHVSTFLPYSSNEKQQIARKRRIGNDIGVIIFQESGSYTPPIKSQFLHCYYVVSPQNFDNGTIKYRFQVAIKEGVPQFGPELEEDKFYEPTSDFRDFLLTKVINGLLASLRHPSLREKIWCKPKEAFLVSTIKQYAKKKEHLSLIEPQPFG